MMSAADEYRLRSLRCQYEVNERNKRLGIVSDEEYQMTLQNVGMQIVYLEEKYGLYEEL